MRNALHDPEPAASRQARAALEYAKPPANSVVVCCSNPGCHHNAELDASRLPDEVTFNDLQHACSAQCAIIAAPTSARRGCIMVD